MDVDNVRPRLLEQPVETAHGVRKVPAHVRLYREPILLQLLAKRAKGGNSVDDWFVTSVPLGSAQLRHQNFGAAHFHAVYDVHNPHSTCRGLRKFLGR
jgi:hypothetical protein